MIDTGKMLESVERLERVFGGETRATQSIGEVKELLVNLRQSEKDAARYRWLRDEAHFKRDNSPLAFFTDANGHWMEFDFDGSSYSILYDKVLDAAIDEAMKCK